MTSNRKRNSLKEEKKMAEAGKVIRSLMPYGMMKDEKTGKTVLYNREYEVLSFGGQKEFDIDPEALDIKYTGIVDERCLKCADGTMYQGRMYFLYISATAPYFFRYDDVLSYLLNYSKVADTVITPIGNAFWD